MRNWHWPALLIAASVIVAAGWVFRHQFNDQLVDLPPTPALAENAFVAEQTCADCHPDQTRDYQTSGHANTFRLTPDSEIARWLAGQTFEDPERPYTYEYHFDSSSGLEVSILKQFGNERFKLPYMLGSGHNALTFLSLLPDQAGDTIGVEHRVSLYANDGGWDLDLTPGHRKHAPGQAVEHFGKLKQGDDLISCVGCHTTQGEILYEEIENLQSHVGCQACHGPGREHVIAMESDRDGVGGYTGFKQQSADQELDVCGRCHRRANVDADVTASDIRIVRFQSVGLPQSRCFTESDSGLKCTTCHDPHQRVSRDKAHYVNQCLQCHGQVGTTECPVSPKENCVSCHMPAIDVHRGIEFHDHWIRVRGARGSGPQGGDGAQ